MSKNIYNINNISDITELPYKYLILLSDDKLNISFDNNSSQVINSFFSQINNESNKNLYFESNDYSYQIDLLETDILNNFEIYIWFVECIRIANQIINSKSNKYIELFSTDKDIWKISICKDIMFNYPFTLHDIIFFPISYIVIEYNLLNKSNISNKSIKSKKIINTLIHEKIHISQRKNEKLWEKFIEQKDNRWKKILSNTVEFKIINFITIDKLIISNIEYIFICNPDTTFADFKYIWIGNNGIKYYSQYLYNTITKKIEKKFFQIDLKNNKLILINTNINLDEEHPYEIYAYKIADELVNNIL
jgi:hypothetical protein